MTAEKESARKVADTAKNVERTTKDIKSAAGAMEASTDRVEDSADRRTMLAADRTALAAERTYAAWVRTGLAALASGIGAKALLTGLVPSLLVSLAGSVLVLFSAFCFGAAVWREMQPKVRPLPETPRLPRTVLVTLNGILIVVSLAALVGLWFGGRQ